MRKSRPAERAAIEHGPRRFATFEQADTSTPNFTDQNQVTHAQAYFAGNSHRARVANNALDRGNFVWHRNPSGLWAAQFHCCHCPQGQGWQSYQGIAGDHIQAQAHGGGHGIGNLQILCVTCNESDLHHRATSIADRTRGGLARNAEDRNRYGQ